MRNEIKGILTKLTQVLEKVEDSLQAAEQSYYPDEDRVGQLEEELELIGEAIEVLESIE